MLECKAPVANRKIEAIKGEIGDLNSRLNNLNTRLTATKVRLFGNVSEETDIIDGDVCAPDSGHLSEITTMLRDAHTSLSTLERSLSEIEEAV